MNIGDQPFVGSEALASGLVKKHQLRAHFRAVFPDVYVPKDAALTVSQRARAAWLYSHRQGLVAGLTASALHGAKWVDDDLPIELIWSNARRPSGLRTYDMRLGSNEFVEFDRMRITTVERTAFDVARRGRLDQCHCPPRRAGQRDRLHRSRRTCSCRSPSRRPGTPVQSRQRKRGCDS